MLSDSINKLLNKEMNTRTASALAAFSGETLASYRLQIEYAKHVGKVAYIPELE